MSEVIAFPCAKSVDALWEEYARLMRAAFDEPGLFMERSHNQAMARAHERWRRVFLGGGG